MAPSSRGHSPSNIPLAKSAEYGGGGSRSQQSAYNFVSPGQPPMGRGDITMDTTQQHHSSLPNRQISAGDVFPAGLDSGGQRSSMGDMAMSYNPPPGGVVSLEGGGGGILGSKRKEGSHQFLPGSKRRSPYNSQSDLPVWVAEDPESSMHPPAGPVSLSLRRASIGSAAQLSDRPVLQKNRSEPSGSIILRVSLKIHTQFR